MARLLALLALAWALSAGLVAAQTIPSLPAATTPLAGTEPLAVYQGGATKKVTVSGVAALAPLAAWTNGITGAVPRPIGNKLSETVSVLDFGAKCDGSTDDTTAINNAILNVGMTGGTVVFPVTGHACMVPTGTVLMKPGVILQGQSYGTNAILGSRISCGGTGDCIASLSTINSSTAVSNGVRDLNVICTNASNTAGAAYDDVGGTFVTIDHLWVQGCGFGVVFDQTELSDIWNSTFNSQVTAGVWWVNDGEHTPGAMGAFTNRDGIHNSQFNEAITVPEMVDDGGFAHEIQGNNFNSGLINIFASGCICDIRDNELEGSESNNIVISGVSYFAGSSTGAPVLTIEANQISPRSGIVGIHAVSANMVMLIGNSFGAPGTHFDGASSINTLFLGPNFLAGGTMLSGTPTHLYSMDWQSSFLTNQGETVTGAAINLNASSNFATNINTGTSTGAVTIGNSLGTVAVAAPLTASDGLTANTLAMTSLLCSSAVPTVTSAGTSPSVSDNNGTCSFTVNVGTGGTATTVVLGLPSAATGWTCHGSDITTQSTSVFLLKQTATTANSATLVNYNTAGAATAFVASDHLRLSCGGD